jgi:3-hydroxyanthranilate 3,4-dioxygenase
MAPPTPLNLMAWIEENRDLLKPPVGNKMIWEDTDFLVMIVGGPNLRTDYHVEEGEELFYQIEGDMIVRLMEESGPRDVTIREGELFLLPPRVPHSPQRPAGTVGMVVERQRKEGELDYLRWYCDGCGKILHQASFQLKDLGAQLKPVIEEYYASKEQRTCEECGHHHEAPGS